MQTQPDEAKKYVEWVERTAFEALKARLATGDMLLAQANTLLSIILVGIGGAMAYGIKVFDAGAALPVVWGSAAAAVWLAAAGAVLVVKCITTRETQALYNEPGNLLLALNDDGTLKYPADRLKRHELDNVQGRIEKTKRRNASVAAWLDRCRIITVATPAPFIVATVIAGLIQRA